MAEIEQAITALEERIALGEKEYSGMVADYVEVLQTALVALRKEKARIDAGIDQYTAETVSMVFDCLPICVGCPGKVNGERTALCDVDNPTQGKCLDQICKLVKEYGDLKAEKAAREKYCILCNGAKFKANYTITAKGLKSKGTAKFCPECGQALTGGDACE